MRTSLGILVVVVALITVGFKSDMANKNAIFLMLPPLKEAEPITDPYELKIGISIWVLTGLRKLFKAIEGDWVETKRLDKSISITGF